jgi:GTPase SAR1 family protein
MFFGYRVTRSLTFFAFILLLEASLGCPVLFADNPFEQLPDEMFEEILRKVEDPQDLNRMAQTDQRAYSLTKGMRVREHSKSYDLMKRLRRHLVRLSSYNRQNLVSQRLISLVKLVQTKIENSSNPGDQALKFVFYGPNGSGKTTLVNYLSEQNFLPASDTIYPIRIMPSQDQSYALYNNKERKTAENTAEGVQRAINDLNENTRTKDVVYAAPSQWTVRAPIRLLSQSESSDSAPASDQLPPIELYDTPGTDRTSENTFLHNEIARSLLKADVAFLVIEGGNRIDPIRYSLSKELSRLLRIRPDLVKQKKLYIAMVDANKFISPARFSEIKKLLWGYAAKVFDTHVFLVPQTQSEEGLQDLFHSLRNLFNVGISEFDDFKRNYDKNHPRSSVVADIEKVIMNERLRNYQIEPMSRSIQKQASATCALLKHALDKTTIYSSSSFIDHVNLLSSELLHETSSDLSQDQVVAALKDYKKKLKKHPKFKKNMLQAIKECEALAKTNSPKAARSPLIYQ